MRLANMCQDVRMRRAGQHNPWHPWGQHWSAWRRTCHKKTCEAFISPRQQRKKQCHFWPCFLLPWFSYILIQGLI